MEPNSVTRTDAKQALGWLQRKGTKKTLAGMSRYGIPSGRREFEPQRTEGTEIWGFVLRRAERTPKFCCSLSVASVSSVAQPPLVQFAKRFGTNATSSKRAWLGRVRYVS